MDDRLHIVFTGGTISMRHDPRLGGNVPVHRGEDLVALVPELPHIAPFEIEDWARLPACHLGPDRVWALRERICALQEGAGGRRPRGIVITHGTDTLEETAYLLARTLPSDVPVAITGAMRTSGEEGWDGARNLRDAAIVAASRASVGRGAMVVFAGKVFAGHEAVKVDTMSLDAFAAPHAAPIGFVADGGVRYEGPPRRPPTVEPRGLDARVALIPVVPGDTGALIDLARPTHDGLVLIAFGSGNVPPGVVPAVCRWLEERKPVVLASRCPTGLVTPAYAFDGGGAKLVALGVQPAGPRTPWQARLELAIALSAGVAYGAA